LLRSRCPTLYVKPFPRPLCFHRECTAEEGRSVLRVPLAVPHLPACQGKERACTGSLGSRWMVGIWTHKRRCSPTCDHPLMAPSMPACVLAGRQPTGIVLYLCSGIPGGLPRAQFQRPGSIGQRHCPLPTLVFVEHALLSQRKQQQRPSAWPTVSLTPRAPGMHLCVQAVRKYTRRTRRHRHRHACSTRRPPGKDTAPLGLAFFWVSCFFFCFFFWAPCSSPTTAARRPGSTARLLRLLLRGRHST
jgi:hypothetical protein